MSKSFRPQVESLDARELPSITPFTFALSNGTLVNGSFDYADAAVDPALASQVIPVSDLTVALNGQTATLATQLSAPVASFALGQFQGVSFAYGISGVAYSAIAVMTDTVAALDLTGNAVTSPVSIVVPPPTNPILQPIPGVGPIDWTAALDAYNANLVALTALQSIITTKMAEHDALNSAYGQLAGQAFTDPNNVLRAIYFAMLPVARAKLIAKEGELFHAYVEYQALYVQAIGQEYALRRWLPLDQRPNLPPLPPEFVLPRAYYGQYLIDAV